ncbi:BatD family protein [Ochrobactrum sp. Q0168]|uniref:BatD family protein n=1 Tax=Ochrobactrum sp. Q0168 TaxID=2793241 RepID=UPI0018EAAFF3|nr:BatD family protein [Ochrobactrum sp. Q0168]
MKILFRLVFFSLFFSTRLFINDAAAQDPIIRAEIEETGTIVPGQQVHLVLTVLAPGFFTSPPQFPLFALPHALVTLPDERSQNTNDTINGVQFSGIEKRYSIIPQVSGSYNIPTIQISFDYLEDGNPKQGTVTSPPLSFMVGAAQQDGQPEFAAGSLELSQSFDRPADKLQTGDALVRTLTITATDTVAITIPPVNVGTSQGLDQYVKPASVADNVAIGRQTASRRIETIVYTASKPGTFSLPAISYRWFDVQSQQVQIATLSQTTVTVVASATKSTSPAAPASKNWPGRKLLWLLAIAALLIASVIAIAIRYRVRFTEALHEWKERRRNSLHHLKRQTLRIIKTGDYAQINTALEVWSRRLGYSSLHDWAAAANDGSLSAQVEILQRQLYGRGNTAEIDRRVLVHGVENRLSHQRALKPPALLELNP